MRFLGDIVNHTRPIHVDLTKMHFPVTAIVSILHRLSGILLFLLLPFLLYCFHQSLVSAAHFAMLHTTLHSPIPLLIMWILLSTICMHLLAGVRHLLMDCGIAEDLSSARVTAWVVITLEITMVFVIGVWLW